MENVSDKKPPRLLGVIAVSCRHYCGYIIRNFGYYRPDKCIRWEAVNNETGEADFHAKRLTDIIKLINEAQKPTEVNNILLCRKCCKPHLLRDEDAGSDREDLSLCVRCYLDH